MTRRQTRLNELFGKQDKLCLSVYVGCLFHSIPDDEFDRLTKAHGFDFSQKGQYDIPSVGANALFDRSEFMMQSGDFRMANILKSQRIYVETNFLSVNKVPDHNLDGEEFRALMRPFYDQADLKLKDVMARYTQEIEKQCGLHFDGKSHAYGENMTVLFRYAIEPYNFDEHHPANLGKLMPITVIEGKTIYPNSQSIKLSNSPEPKR